jgi:hypothetical protein
MDHMSHEEYVALQRRRVGALARDILDGKLDILEGAREIVRLRHELEVPEDDPDLNAFVVIESETDALPIGRQREHWAVDVLARREPELADARKWAFEIAKEECRNLVARFAPSN